VDDPYRTAPEPKIESKEEPITDEDAYILQWAKNLADEQAWVLHTESGLVVRIAKFYDGKDECYVSPVNGSKVTAPVLEMHNKHALMAKPENFVQLSENEVAYFVGTQEVLTGALREMVAAGAIVQIPAPTVALLLIGVFREQMIVLQQGHEQLVQAAAQLMRERHNAGDGSQEPTGDANADTTESPQRSGDSG
jgi:hypothetical protein